MDDVLHVFDGDSLYAAGLQLVEQFGDACFNVVGNFFSALATAKVTAQRVGVSFQQFVGILVDGIEAAQQVYGDILFHDS